MAVGNSFPPCASHNARRTGRWRSLPPLHASGTDRLVLPECPPPAQLHLPGSSSLPTTVEVVVASEYHHHPEAGWQAHGSARSRSSLQLVVVVRRRAGWQRHTRPEVNHEKWSEQNNRTDPTHQDEGRSIGRYGGLYIRITMSRGPMVVSGRQNEVVLYCIGDYHQHWQLVTPATGRQVRIPINHAEVGEEGDTVSHRRQHGPVSLSAVRNNQ